MTTTAQLALRSPTGAARLLVRFAGSIDAEQLSQRGVQLERQLPSGAWVVRGSNAALRELALQPAVLQIDDAGVSPFLQRLDRAMLDETRVMDAARATLATRGAWLDGTGETIADVDSDAFVFHPSLFRADAGAFDWIDNDGNGVFDADVDAIDLDGDGVAAESERARPIRVEFRDLSFAEFDAHDDFDATLDYLYQDDNGNRRRDFGAGFTESTPAFGEPLFVVDDVDGNGRLDRGERVLRLGSSKFAKVHKRGKTYERGNQQGRGILDYGLQWLDRPSLAAAPQHGTYMTAVIAGGNGSQRIRGIAPGADLILVPEPTVEDIGWLVDQKVVATSLPIGITIGTPLDGSSELDRMVDTLRERGIFTTVSVGNDVGLKAHAALEATSETPLSLPFETWYPSDYAYFSLLVHDPTATLEVSAVDADGAPLAGQQGYTELSPRGTRMTLVWLPARNVPAGTRLQITVRGITAPRTLHVYASGDAGFGTRFLEHVATSTTIGSPATADRSFASTGYVLHAGDNYGIADQLVGELASFASQGPRLDGRALLGLAAPVNPIGATYLADDPASIAVRAWPGTSCASPQIAAAAALLHQIDPSATADVLEERLLTSARSDSFTSEDANRWAAGKLDVAAALGLSAVSLPAPEISLVAPASAAAESTFRVHVEAATVEASSLRARWDFDYDGVWDTGFEPLGERELRAPAEQRPTVIRVEVHDAAGNTRGAAARIETLANDGTAAPTSDLGLTGGGCGVAPATSGSAQLSFILLTIGAVTRRIRRRSTAARILPADCACSLWTPWRRPLR